MKKFILPVVLLLVGLGLGFSIPHGAKQEQSVGGTPVNDKSFVYGLHAGSSDQWSVDSSGNVTTTGTETAASFKLPSTSYAVSSSSPAALGSATRGQFVMAASANTANASSTAIVAGSLIILQNSATTTIPGVTCFTGVASSTQVSSKIPGNGFIVKAVPAPTTNPYCFDFHVVNP